MIPLRVKFLRTRHPQFPRPLLPLKEIDSFYPQAIKNSKRMWLDGEVLLWQASEDCLDYALKSDSQTSIKDGRIKSPDFEWDWGVRLGLGIKIPYDQWDLLFTYTHVHAHAHGSASAPSDGAVFPVMQAPFGLPSNFFADHARFRLDANLNIGDIELGRKCFAGKWPEHTALYGSARPGNRSGHRRGL